MKKQVMISLLPEIHDKCKSKGINVSSVCQRALSKEINKIDKCPSCDFELVD
jgi:post-segregation antitoxin (ccd killing protein)